MIQMTFLRLCVHRSRSDNIFGQCTFPDEGKQQLACNLTFSQCEYIKYNILFKKLASVFRVVSDHNNAVPSNKQCRLTTISTKYVTSSTTNTNVKFWAGKLCRGPYRDATLLITLHWSYL